MTSSKGRQGKPLDLSALSKLAVDVSTEENPDTLDKLEFRAASNRRMKIHLDGEEQMVVARRQMGDAIRHFLWAVFILAAFSVLASSLNWGWFKVFSVPTQVQIALVATTAVSAIGAVVSYSGRLFR